jgi:hypothetical protein
MGARRIWQTKACGPNGWGLGFSPRRGQIDLRDAGHTDGRRSAPPIPPRRSLGQACFTIPRLFLGSNGVGSVLGSLQA